MNAGDNPQRAQKKKKKRTDKKKEATKDRLAEAINEKFLNVEIDGKKLRMQRWNFIQGLRVSKNLATIIKKATPLGFTAESLMVADIGGILAEHEEHICEILAVSVVKNNFMDEDEAIAWVKELDFPDAIELFGYVIKLDLIPLAQRAGKLKGLLSGIPGLEKTNAVSPKESQPQT